jgi:hypothetical protein
MDRLNSDQSNKSFTVVGLVVSVLGLVIVGYILNQPEESNQSRIPKPASQTPAVEPVDLPLQARAGCQAGRVVVTNESSELWLDPKIEINGEFTFVGDAIAPKTTMRYQPGIFARTGGARLDLDAVACKRIDIHATVDGKRRHWNGAKP